jgi:hypothetical protein
VANAPRFKVKRIDKRLDETHRVSVSDIIIQPWRAWDLCVAVCPCDVAYSGRTLPQSKPEP